jgi:hypothetical protein
MSITMRRLARTVTGEPRCHFLVQWRDSHAEQHGRTFATFDEAAAFDAAIKAGRLPRDAPGRRTSVTFGTVAGRWLATKQATKRPSTADLYATELRCHVLPAFASVPLPGITRRDVHEWVNALAASGLAPATVRHAYRAVFKSVLNDAVDDGLLARSPCHRRELPAVVLPVIDPLTPAQILTLASRIDPRYRAMVWLAAGCGLRWSEAAGLTADRFHLGSRAQVTIDRQLAYRPATTRRKSNAGSPSLFAPPKTGASRRASPGQGHLVVHAQSPPWSKVSWGHDHRQPPAGAAGCPRGSAAVGDERSPSPACQVPPRPPGHARPGARPAPRAGTERLTAARCLDSSGEGTGRCTRPVLARASGSAP